MEEGGEGKGERVSRRNKNGIREGKTLKKGRNCRNYRKCNRWVGEGKEKGRDKVKR